MKLFSYLKFDCPQLFPKTNKQKKSQKKQEEIGSKIQITMSFQLLNKHKSNMNLWIGYQLCNWKYIFFGLKSSIIRRTENNCCWEHIHYNAMIFFYFCSLVFFLIFNLLCLQLSIQKTITFQILKIKKKEIQLKLFVSDLLEKAKALNLIEFIWGLKYCYSLSITVV